MRVLVTGSAGGIGTWMVKRLLEAGHTLRTLDRTARRRADDWEHLPGDIRDLSLVRRAVAGMDAVVHLAAIPFDMPGNAEQVLSINIQGTCNVYLACAEAEVPRVVNFSSINALGHAEPTHHELYLPLDDDVPHHPAQPYYISKHVGEELGLAFATRHGMHVVSLRPTMVTYPGSSEGRWWEMLPEERRAAFSTKDFWSYVDVRDVCEAALLGLTAPVEGHQAFLLTADDTTAHISSAELVAKYYAHLPWPKISRAEYLAGDPYRSLVDCSQAKQVLGWQPKYSRRDPNAGYGQS
jgi:UDP-glucose 4-epimerase